MTTDREQPVSSRRDGAGHRALVSAAFEELLWFELPDICLT